MPDTPKLNIGSLLYNFGMSETPSDAPPALDRSLREANLFTNLMRLCRIYRKTVNDAAHTHGLSDAKMLPIVHLSRLGDGVRQGVLADDMGIEGPSLGRLLEQLIAAGFIERRDDSADRRARLLFLTERGQAMAATMERLITELRSQLLAKVPDVDIDATLRVLAALDAALHPEPSTDV